MVNRRQQARSRRALLVGSLLLTVVGVVLLVVALTTQRHAPQPPASAAIAQPTASQTAGATGTSAGSQPSGSAAGSAPGSNSPRSASPKAAAPSGPILPRSTPTELSIPSLGVKSDLLDLGLAADDSVEVPPLSRDSKAGWYRYSPTPGQLGPAVILGHVDSAKYGPGVFFKLGALKPGSLVNVTRADSTVAVFRVDRVVAYPKNNFPTVKVYGNTANAALRLITCGGKFDFKAHNYLSNIVAYASLVSSHHA